MSCSLCPL
uniref:Uncharacterized protein n=1 Tax=Anguilla anguilla TaxID=7936 RepID=A0A0E9U622_ANGAN